MADVFFPGASYDITFSSAASTPAPQAVSKSVTMVRVLATVNCYIAFGGTATKPGSVRLATAFGEYFRVVPGVTIAAIPDSGTTGVVTITEMSGG